MLHFGKKSYFMCACVKFYLRQQSRNASRITPERLSKILNIAPESAQRLVLKVNTGENVVLKTFSILEKYGFGSNAIVQHPKILSLSPSAVENYLLCMMENGFTEITPGMIARYPTISKRTIALLKSCKLVANKDELIRNYCKVLGVPASVEENVWKSLPTKIDDVSLFELRVTMITCYIAEVLNTNVVTSNKIMKTYPRTHYRSFEWLKNTVNILLNDVKFSTESICKHGYLLQANPTNILEILNKVEYLSGVPIREFAHIRPKILMSTASTLTEINSLFRKSNISDEAVLKYPQIYTLSSQTIRERLEELNVIPEFSALRHHPRVARLLYYQTKVKTRLEYLSTNNMTGASLHMLSTDTKRFNKSISQGDLRTKGLDVINYLAEYFDERIPNVRKQLMKQPHWLQISLLVVQDSLEFLESFIVFPKSIIFDCLPILLYPREKIKAEMDSVLESDEAALEDLYFLNMVLYFLERQVHFTGDGVWPNKIRGEGDDVQIKDDGEDVQAKSDIFQA